MARVYLEPTDFIGVGHCLRNSQLYCVFGRKLWTAGVQLEHTLKLVVEPTKDYKSTGHTKSTRHLKSTKDSKPRNTMSSNIWGSSMREKTKLSIVDRILMEESSCDKHSKTGSVNKTKNCNQTLLRLFIHMDKWYIILFPSRNKLNESYNEQTLWEWIANCKWRRPIHFGWWRSRKYATNMEFQKTIHVTER